jgi:hypothetical protein
LVIAEARGYTDVIEVLERAGAANVTEPWMGLRRVDGEYMLRESLNCQHTPTRHTAPAPQYQAAA